MCSDVIVLKAVHAISEITDAVAKKIQLFQTSGAAWPDNLASWIFNFNNYVFQLI